MDEYRHFSHPHELRLYQIQPQDTNQFHCSGCHSPCHGAAVYGCWACKFFLHKACAAAARSLCHPSHPPHPFTLLPSPTYPDASFLCNACGATGTAFCFSCAACDVDLHVNCALLPLELDLKSHHHKLSLIFSPQHGGGGTDVCSVCRRAVESSYWSYSCLRCNFHVHTSCATPPKLQAAAALVARASPHQREEADYGGVSYGGGNFRRAENEYGAAYGNVAAAAANPSAAVVEDPILKAQAELHELQMQLQIANEMAKMMASFNLSSLAP